MVVAGPEAMQGLIYAAYNSAPPQLPYDTALENRWYETLRSEKLIGGLELSFDGTLHPNGTDRLAELLSEGWRNVISDVPCTMSNIELEEMYGLASTSTRGRVAAITDVRRMFVEVKQLQQLLGPSVIRAVELHSAPRAVAGRSSFERFAESLSEIAAWDWGEVILSVEHADALVSDHAPEKGFLAIASETLAVAVASERSGRTLVQSVNWGRSVIETHTKDGPTAHLEHLLNARRLGGLIFSGVSGKATPSSRPWQDAHLPMAESEPASLLDKAGISNALKRIDVTELSFLGVKVGSSASAEHLADKLAPGMAALYSLHELLTQCEQDP